MGGVSTFQQVRLLFEKSERELGCVIDTQPSASSQSGRDSVCDTDCASAACNIVNISGAATFVAEVAPERVGAEPSIAETAVPRVNKNPAARTRCVFMVLDPDREVTRQQ